MGKSLSMMAFDLDGKECFYILYVEMGRGGSLQKLGKHLKNKGVYNAENGKPYSTSALFQSIWRWVLNNIEEAEPIYKNYILSFGRPWNEEKWRMLIHTRAVTYLTRAQARRFFERHPRFS